MGKRKAGDPEYLRLGGKEAESALILPYDLMLSSVLVAVAARGEAQLEMTTLCTSSGSLQRRSEFEIFSSVISIFQHYITKT